MADLLGVATSALSAQKTALGTVGHNIANVNTKGYSRQNVQFVTNQADQLGGNYIGAGMNVSGIRRIADEFITDQLRRDTQGNASFTAYSEYAVRIDSLLGDSATAVPPTLLKFFGAVSDVANDPSSIPARQVLVSEGSALANRFNAIYDQVSQQNITLNEDLKSTTAQITAIASQIASLNESITSSRSIGTPNDLLDSRDEKLRELSELVGIETIKASDGSINVTIGTGQAIVVGNNSYTVRATDALSGVTRAEIEVVIGTSTVRLSQGVSGGRLGGLLEVREQLIDPVFNEIGRMGLAIADSINQQHRLGTDIRGALGKDFFTDINTPTAEISRASTNISNTGTAALTVTIDDVSALTADNYGLTYSNATGNYTLTETTNNTVITSFAAPVPTPGSVSLPSLGFTVNFTAGAPDDTDSFLLTPTRFAGSEMNAEISNTSDVAAGMPIRANVPSGNVGTGTVEVVQVTDVTTADFTTTPLQLSPPYEVQFVTPTTYNVFDMSVPAAPVLVNAVPIAFVPNQSNNLLANAGLTPGYEVVFTGEPIGGDVVEITYSANGIGDNRNMLLLADLQSAKIMSGGTANFQSAYSQTVGGVGTRTRDSLIGREASESVLRQTTAQRESVSGVNLDEEAADLIKFQQAYEASARIIQVSSELFDTLLATIR